MKKWIILGIVLLLLAFSLRFVVTGKLGWGMGQPEFRYHASELYEFYQADEAAGNQKLIGKIIEVEGDIAEVSTDENGSTVVILREPGAFGGVMCTMDGRVEDMKVGSTVRIKGMCTGFLFDVVKNHCKSGEPTGRPSR